MVGSASTIIPNPLVELALTAELFMVDLPRRSDHTNGVAKFRIDHLAKLAHQLEFTPADTRGVQVAAAEELLHDIDPAKAYPLDFVVHRITGYRPREVPDELLTGLALQYDLGLLIEKVSETLDIHVAELTEPVLTIDDVSERFSVTSKTIQRWRKKGLPSRRFIFPDGKRRVGFLLRSVERFVALHGDAVAEAANFSQVDDAERDNIVRRARRLATQCRCCRNEIARRIARKLHRSPLTILHTIRKFDNEHPDQSVFELAPPPLSDAEKTRVARGVRRGIRLAVMARRMCRPRSAIYRVVVDGRVEKLTARQVKFIDDPLYHADDAESQLKAMVASEDLGAAGDREQLRIPRDLPPYLADLYRTPLLTPARERALFLQFNYYKYLFVTARRRFDPQLARARDVTRLERHLRDATAVKNRIVQANLRLVVSVAKRHIRPGLNLMDLVSDGNITLMRAVESFDVHKGNRFSTYATLALMKGFARSVPEMLADQRHASVSSGDGRELIQVTDPRSGVSVRQLLDRDEVIAMLSRLDETERRVIQAHFGLGEALAVEVPTYEQIGRELGLTRTRVRQVEERALAKLRTALAK